MPVESGTVPPLSRLFTFSSFSSTPLFSSLWFTSSLSSPNLPLDKPIIGDHYCAISYSLPCFWVSVNLWSSSHAFLRRCVDRLQWCSIWLLGLNLKCLSGSYCLLLIVSRVGPILSIRLRILTRMKYSTPVNQRLALIILACALFFANTVYLIIAAILIIQR